MESEERCKHEVWVFSPEYCCDKKLVCQGCGKFTRAHRVPNDVRRGDEVTIDADGIVRKR